MATHIECSNEELLFFTENFTESVKRNVQPELSWFFVSEGSDRKLTAQENNNKDVCF